MKTILPWKVKPGMKHVQNDMDKNMKTDDTKRIEEQTPFDGAPIPVTHPEFELSAWRLPNGARHVVLRDDSDATWEAYCRMLAGTESSH